MHRNNGVGYDDYDLNSYGGHKKTGKIRRKSTRAGAGKIALTVVCLALALILSCGIGLFAYVHFLLGKMERVDISDKVSVASEAGQKYQDYINIALLGIDTRGKGYNDGRSDAVIILTLDSVHNKIKITSISRDSYVEIKGRKHKDKLTHAYAYAATPDERAALSVDTINRNFDMDITDVVTINFYGFADIIDSIGGVMIDVSEAERKVMNTEYIPYIKKQGIKCEKVQSAGYQRLSGGQALAYSRDRYTGSELERGSRQREVLAAMYDEVKSAKLTELPSLVSTVLENCTTSLTNSEMIKMASWAMAEHPSVENIGLPSEDCNPRGSIIDGTWYYVYDIDTAKKELHDFILETGGYIDPKSSAVTSA